ncbi:ABC-F family ATP-binding cassette domain-containing protein [Actinospica sp.]|uniref:ABC-F family ATP-binding cassette domain-containing protein n=1 Tax=Actinospica sp. TaxID=1872142 RepID=UPI002C0B3EE2|nr:ABC-F family ATP-binding cassette domain-containing protein [Actinospica sp.]HWG27345.1 ABC-F family ATP-binding cassette domain-containing protein [Actinospica sp.]
MHAASQLSYLKATGLSLAFHAEPLFDGLSLALGAGDRVALVGPNGVGKSTLLKILAGRLAATEGRVELGPNARLGYFAQQVPDPAETVGGFVRSALAETFDIESRLRELESRLSDGDTSALGEYGTLLERFEALDGWTAEARVADVRHRLDVAHLPDDAKLAQVSGGEQARLMLARVLLADPTVLLLDEPTNHLDADAIDWLADFLARFTGGILVISHDRAFLDRMANRVIELDGIHDELQEYEGGYTAYKAEKQARWQKLLLDYEAQEKQRARLAADIEATKGHALATETATTHDHWRRIAKKVAKKAKVRERRLERELQSARWIAEPQTRPTLTLAFAKTKKPRHEFVLQATDLAVTAGPRTLFTVPSLDIRTGGRVLITGPNGAGKSSLLNEIAARLPEAGVLPQTHDHLRLDTAVIDYFRSRVPIYPEDAEQILTGYLFAEDQWHAPLRTLSAGELRRLLLAIVVNQGARVLLLDEPTNYLDFDSLDVIERALTAFTGTIVSVTHDRYFADAIGFKTHWRVADGRLDED